MDEDTVHRNMVRKFFRIDASFFRAESFLGLGFESVFVAVFAGLIFGFLIGIYPTITSIFPFLPTTNLFLFIAFGIPLTGSTHFDPHLGMLSSTVMLGAARAAQILFGIAPASQEFLVLAGVWSITQVFLIGYLPGKLIQTSEDLEFLFKGMVKVTVLYAVAEEVIWAIGTEASLSTVSLLTFPVLSIPLLLVVSTITTFIFTSTFCPYMMIPLISSSVKGQRNCGAGNFVFKLGGPVSIGGEQIKKAQKKGFRLISQLPSVTVFSCPRGGIISVYNSGDMLIRKVNKGTAERINRHLTPIFNE